MPYYRWSGIDLTGAIHRGKQYAKSIKHLDSALFEREIALMRAQKAWTLSLSLAVRARGLADFFRQLSILLAGGIRIPEAVTLVADQLHNGSMRDIAHRVADDVRDGASLSTAMRAYPKVFTNLMIQLVQAGEESGNLAESLDALSTHIETARAFARRLRMAIMLPLITFFFFCAIALMVLLVVVPRFADTFNTLGKPIPPLTRSLLNVSEFLQTGLAFYGFMGFIGILIAVWAMRRFSSCKRMIDAIVLRLPFIGAIITGRFVAYFFESLAILLKSGVHVLPALELLHNAIGNSVLKEKVGELYYAVAAGSSLSQALALTKFFVGHDALSLVAIGEQSGALSAMIYRVAQIYQDKVQRTLSTCTMTIQPLLMIIMGCLVVLLIIAVYGPLCNLSDII